MNYFAKIISLHFVRNVARLAVPTGVLILIVGQIAVGQDLSIAASAGSDGDDSANAVAVDLDGNIFVAGHFEGSAVFSEGESNEVSIDSDGLTDIFLAKYANSGELDWVIREGDERVEQALGLTVDLDGFIYVTGLFADTSTFGRGQPGETTLIAADNTSHNGFVAKYSPEGTLEWARWAGNNQARGIATDSSGNAYVTGFFFGDATFGAGEPGEQTLSSDGSNDGFVAKFSRSGTFLWATSVAGAGFDAIYGANANASGYIYVSGNFEDGATIEANGPNETTLTSAGDVDAFIAKIDSTGLLQWVKTFGGPGADAAFAVASTADGAVSAAGRFNGELIFGGGEPNETTLTSSGGSDIFVAAFDEDGGLQWAKRSGGAADDLALSVSISSTKVVVATGGFKGSSTFGPGEPGETTLTSSGANDIFVSKYDSTGSLLWAKNNGSPLSLQFGEFGLGVVIDKLDNVVAVGNFEGAATFGRGEQGQTTLNSKGASDAFMIRYGNAVHISTDKSVAESRSLEIYNYPNPFHGSTTLRFYIPSASIVRLTVFDTLGRVVSEVANRHYPEGWHDALFSAAGLAAGVYFGRVESGSASTTVSVLHSGSK